MAEQKIDINSIKDIDIKKIALKDDYGALKFQKSCNYLEKLQTIFNEFEDLQYKIYLSKPEIADIEGRKAQFISYLNRINGFNLSSSNPKPEHDQIENEIERSFNDTVQNTKTNLVFLRQEAALKSQDAQDLKNQQNEVLKLRTELERTKDDLQTELQIIRNQKEKIENAQGEVAVVTLAKHFREQVDEDRGNEDRWLRVRDRTYWGLIILILANIVAYVFIRSIFTIEYGLAKLALISVISYGLGFASKNYNIAANMRTINKHRQNVAQTIESFLASNPDSEIKSELIKQGTEAMFSHLPIGYIGKSELKESGPVYELINNYIKPKTEM